MGEQILAALERIERSDGARLVALLTFTALLALVFLALLIGDQVKAATF